MQNNFNQQNFCSETLILLGSFSFGGTAPFALSPVPNGALR